MVAVFLMGVVQQLYIIGRGDVSLLFSFCLACDLLWRRDLCATFPAAVSTNVKFLHLALVLAVIFRKF